MGCTASEREGAGCTSKVHSVGMWRPYGTPSLVLFGRYCRCSTSHTVLGPLYVRVLQSGETATAQMSSDNRIACPPTVTHNEIRMATARASCHSSGRRQLANRIKSHRQGPPSTDTTAMHLAGSAAHLKTLHCSVCICAQRSGSPPHNLCKGIAGPAPGV